MISEEDIKKLVELIAQEMVEYMNKNADLFLKHFDLLTKTMDAAVHETIKMVLHIGIKMGGMDQETLFKGYSELSAALFLKHVKTLPDHSIMIKEEILDAWTKTSQVTMNRIAEFLESHEKVPV